MSRPYTLYYWGGIAGRAEPMRLILHAGGNKFAEVNDVDEIKKLLDLDEGGTFFGVPVVARPAGAIIGQSHVIMKVLGQAFNFEPKNPLEETRAEMVDLTMGDVFGEISRAMMGGEEAAGKWKAERLPKTLKFIHKHLAMHQGGWVASRGPRPTYADFSVLYMLICMADTCPDEFAAACADLPLIASYKEKMSKLPHLAGYLESGTMKPHTMG